MSPITGIEREPSFVLMTREQFNQRIKRSYLWESLLDKKLENASHGNSYYFNKLFKEIGFGTNLQLTPRYAEPWSIKQTISKIEYGVFDKKNATNTTTNSLTKKNLKW